MNPEPVFNYFPSLSKQQQDQIMALGELYAEWNERINVISRKDLDQLYIHHVLHSLALQKYTLFGKGQKVLDVGTGGGFPGIPLAILNPDTEFLLVDSIAKKIRVVEAICTALNLKNATARHIRSEELTAKFDLIVTRAVAQSTKLLEWNLKNLRNTGKFQDTGIIALKGGDLKEELGKVKRPYKIKELSEYFKEDFFETKKIVHFAFRK